MWTYTITFFGETIGIDPELLSAMLQPPSPNFILQGRSKIVQRCNRNSETEASEDSSDFAEERN